jgi:hypothetical protein
LKFLDGNEFLARLGMKKRSCDDAHRGSGKIFFGQAAIWR